MSFKHCHNTNHNTSVVLLGRSLSCFTSNYSNSEESCEIQHFYPHFIEAQKDSVTALSRPQSKGSK